MLTNNPQRKKRLVRQHHKNNKWSLTVRRKTSHWALKKTTDTERLKRTKMRKNPQPNLVQVWEVILEVCAEGSVILVSPKLVVGVKVEELIKVDSARNSSSSGYGQQFVHGFLINTHSTKNAWRKGMQALFIISCTTKFGQLFTYLSIYNFLQQMSTIFLTWITFPALKNLYFNGISGQWKLN